MKTLRLYIAVLMLIIVCKPVNLSAEAIAEQGKLIIQLVAGSSELSDWIKSGRTGSIASLNSVLPPGYTSQGYFADNFFRTSGKNNKLLAANSKRTAFIRTVLVSFEGNYDPVLLASKVSEYECVEYAEPVYERHFVSSENDSLYEMQYYLSMVNAEAARDQISGNDTIVVGVVDTGVDYNHEDLIDNMYINPGESGLDANGNDKRNNGIDDDENGCIDDFRGWDFVGKTYGSGADNDPFPGHNHGTHCSGIVAATINNGKGIAGVAKNVKILPVKIGEDATTSTGTYSGMSGIMYASDMKADIINCSWGGEGYSITEAALIDYVTSAGSLVVAAAGNDNSSDEFYPANYKGALSVAAVDKNWNYAYFTNYGPWVDISAPGVSILSTITGSSYGKMSGTSMASPVAAGCAALAMLAHPNYSVTQIRELLKATANKKLYEYYPQYVGFFGTGVVDALTAVNANVAYGVNLLNYNFTKSGDTNRISIGDKFYIDIKFTNILSALSDLKVAIAPRNENTANYVKINNDMIDVGQMNTSVSKAIDSAFSFTATANVPGDCKLQFYVYFINGNDTIRTELIYTLVNRSYINFSNNDIAITINSRGNYAFNDYPKNIQGIGMTYKDGESLLFEGSTMMTTSYRKSEDTVCVIDVARSQNSSQNKGFKYNKIVNYDSINNDWKVATSNFQSYISDTLLNFPYNFDVICNTYASKADSDRNYIVCEYITTNTSSLDVDSCYLGMYFDWDIGISGRSCIAEYNVDDGIAWNFSTEDSTLPVVGVKPLTTYPVNYYGIENNNTDDTGIGVYNGFTDNEKYTAMTSGIANYMTSATDISQVISAGPFPLKSGETKKIAFAILVGKDYAEIAEAALRAENFEKSGVDDIENTGKLTAFPNPNSGKEMSVMFDCTESDIYSMELFDVTGNRVQAFFDGRVLSQGAFSEKFDISSIPSGTYFLKIYSSTDDYICKVIIRR